MGGVAGYNVPVVACYHSGPGLDSKADLRWECWHGLANGC